MFFCCNYFDILRNLEKFNKLLFVTFYYILISSTELTGFTSKINAQNGAKVHRFHRFTVHNNQHTLRIKIKNQHHTYKNVGT